jgi:hypothetical protein
MEESHWPSMEDASYLVGERRSLIKKKGWTERQSLSALCGGKAASEISMGDFRNSAAAKLS